MKLLQIITITLLLGLVSNLGVCQDEKVNWSIAVEDDGDKQTLVISGKTIPGWHIYTTNPPDPLAGPLPTYIELEESDKFEKIGEIEEKTVETHVNSIGEKEGVFVSNPGIFQIEIKRKTSDAFNIPIFIEYQTCDDSKCINAQANLMAQILAQDGTNNNNPLKDSNVIVDKPQNLVESNHAFSWKIQAYKMDSTNYQVNLTPIEANTYEVLYDNNTDVSINPISDNFELQDTIHAITYQSNNSQSGEAFKALTPGAPYSFFLKTKADEKNIKFAINYTAISKADSFSGFGDVMETDLNNATVLTTSTRKEQSYWAIFFIAFLSGFAALLTPCVFPMIPMTVSFFTKTSKTKAMGIKNAILYAISIIVIYVVLGLAVTGAFGSDALNALSTNVWFNIAFFLLLIIFGISFLGAFEITLPSKWVNKVDRQADKGGLIGIFFMAFALALVSFSCTGPIIGTLLVAAADQGGLSPFFGMLGFSLALALPFGLFAAFPGWLNSLPKSGGWLNSVKVVLGLLEIAFALKFLSKADLVTQSHLLEREMFLAIWIVLFTIIGLYLLGKIKFPHDSPLNHISIPRFGFAVIALVFAVYMIPGLWGAPLNILAGFPPPPSYSESPYGIGGEPPEHGDIPEGGHKDAKGILMFEDLAFARAYADDVDKPLMLDFTGFGCENCRKMEQNVWYHKDILSYMQDSVVVASLHADDKTLLPKEQQVTKTDGYRVRSVGNKWSYLERTRYGEQSQPLYVMLDKANQMCGIKASYETHGEVELFKEWLNSNLTEYRARKNAKVVIDDGIPEN